MTTFVHIVYRHIRIYPILISVYVFALIFSFNVNCPVSQNGSHRMDLKREMLDICLTVYNPLVFLPFL